MFTDWSQGVAWKFAKGESGNYILHDLAAEATRTPPRQGVQAIYKHTDSWSSMVMWSEGCTAMLDPTLVLILKLQFFLLNLTMDIYMDIHGCPCMSMGVNGCPWILKDILGYPWTSMRDHRGSPGTIWMYSVMRWLFKNSENHDKSFFVGFLWQFLIKIVTIDAEMIWSFFNHPSL